jgi:hypothetical protein
VTPPILEVVELSEGQERLWTLVAPGMLLLFGSVQAADLGYHPTWLGVVGLIGLVTATGAIVVVLAWKSAELLRRRMNG